MRKTSPDVPPTGWVPGCEAVWRAPTLLTSVRNNSNRRFSATSDSGDTGIGTSSSDSIEDHSSSSGISSFKPNRSHITIPTAHVMPSTSNSSSTRPGHQDGAACTKYNITLSQSGKPKNLSTPKTILDMKDPRPIRKWSSLSKLCSAENCNPECGAAGNVDSLNNMEDRSNYNVEPNAYGVNVPDNFTYQKLECLRSEDTQSWSTCSKEPTQNLSSVSHGGYKYENFCRGAGDSSFPATTPNKNHLDFKFSALHADKTTSADCDASGKRHSFKSLESQSVHGTPAPSSLRTQLWLSDQMQTNSLDLRSAEGSCGFPVCQHKQHPEQLKRESDSVQMPNKSPLQVSLVYPTQLSQDSCERNSQLKMKENLLRKKDIVIERQIIPYKVHQGSRTECRIQWYSRRQGAVRKQSTLTFESQEQQIIRLQQKIQENELRAQRALLERCDPAFMIKTQHESPCESMRHIHHIETSKVIDCGKKNLEQKLSAAELEIVHLNECLRKNTQKYLEEAKKMEEKVKAREKYISSLKKKLQKESEQSHERQQRIETLEKYLADLPTLNDFQSQSQQLILLEEKNEKFQDTFKDLEKKLGENRILCREKEVLLESQKKREKALVATVQSLQQKVEKCLEDGARLPMLDMKQLQCENDYLRKMCEHANKVIDNQEQQIKKCNLEKQALEERLTQEKSASQTFRKELGETQRNLQLLKELMEEFSSKNQRLPENSTLEEQSQETEEPKQSLADETPAIEKLLKEMSSCLRDLRALCNILTQRAQGKEPNLSLLLGIQSLHCSGDEGEHSHCGELLSKKLSDVCQLRKDIDELRTIISDRYAQDMGDNCITQ
ncbi:centrosomal protein of 85 kDa-like isoform X2 [Chiloscyllium plagiosum]|uniref:centrosomal protein of 85 kDa-like isoform X2 n=1 Tax=Chiloscyllium plagiosum TaxID=36176 RepID=UPI001CB7C242|nr:centrosomal protein of 85 kDa-like isoform X2 [Chiloscyllium plagiosum]